MQDLQEEILVYLLGSRYCETDRLSETAWSLFATAPLGWGPVRAVCDSVHRHLVFGYRMRGQPRRRARHSTTATVYAGTTRTWPSPSAATSAASRPRAMSTRPMRGIVVASIERIPAFRPLPTRWISPPSSRPLPQHPGSLLHRLPGDIGLPSSSTFGPNTLVSFKVWR